MNSFELYQQAAEAESYRREQESAARAALPCPHCGSTEGLEQVYAPELYDWVEEPETFPLPARGLYQGQADDELYTPCPVCNPAGRVPTDLRPLNGVELQAWVLARYPQVSHWQRQQRLINGQPLVPAQLSSE